MILKFYFSVWKTLYNATVILPIWSCCCSQVKGTELHKFPHFKNTSNNFWGSQVTWTSDQLAKKSGVSIIPSCSLIHYNNSQNSEKHYDYNFITKDTNLNQPMKRCIGLRSGTIPNPKLLCPQDASSSAHINVYHQPGDSTKVWCLKFLLAFHYEGMIGYLLELNLQASYPSLEVWLISYDWKSQPSNHKAKGLLEWPASTLNHLIRIN